MITPLLEGLFYDHATQDSRYSFVFLLKIKEIRHNINHTRTISQSMTPRFVDQVH
jgi:hypothetical protein